MILLASTFSWYFHRGDERLESISPFLSDHLDIRDLPVHDNQAQNNNLTAFLDV
jgi:hypothetical protein